MTSHNATASPPTMEPLTRCWVCGGDGLSPVVQGRFDMTWMPDPVLTRYHNFRYDINRCGGCGFLQPAGLPAESDYFDRLYSKDRGTDWMELDFDTPYKDFFFHGILRDLARLLPANRRSVLDVGAHVGRFIYLANQAGWQAEGAELNPNAAAYAAKRTGLPVYKHDARQLIAQGKRYNAVTLTDVLEHIPNPVPLLADLRDLLTPGGWLAVKVPCGHNQLLKERIRYRLGRTPEAAIGTNIVHINHFCPQALRLALVKAGYRNIRLRTGAPEFVFGWSPKPLLSSLFRLAVFYAARLPGAVHTPLAFNLQAYAQCDS